jgi:hypothetical protein
VDDFLGLVNRFGAVGKDFLEVGNHVLAVVNRFLLPLLLPGLSHFSFPSLA